MFRLPVRNLVAIAVVMVVCVIPVGATALTQNALEAALNQVDELGLAPGFAIAVVRGDETVLLSARGLGDMESGRLVTPDSLFYIASSTKSFTGLAAALLDLQGKLDLDAPITRHLPGLILAEGLQPVSISLRDLLSHTHGISNNGPVTFRLAYSGEHTPDLLKELLKFHAAAAQGREFRYGNIGYNLASLVMDEALGVSWKRVLEREIFQPLGMESTTGYLSEVDPNRLALPHGIAGQSFERLRYSKGDSNMHAAGGLLSSAADLARWLKANISRGVTGGERLLPEAAFLAAHQSITTQSGSNGPFQRHGYGLGWNLGSLDGEPLIYHFGGFSGFHSHVSFMPDARLGVAVLVNASRTGPIVADLLARLAYAHLSQRAGAESEFQKWVQEARNLAGRIRDRVSADRSRRAARPQTLPHPLKAYAGVYENPLMGRTEWKIVNDRLEVTMGLLWSAVEVYDGAKNALRVELAGGGDVVEFQFQDNRAVSFVVDGMTFARVKPD